MEELLRVISKLTHKINYGVVRRINFFVHFTALSFLSSSSVNDYRSNKKKFTSIAQKSKVWWYNQSYYFVNHWLQNFGVWTFCPFGSSCCKMYCTVDLSFIPVFIPVWLCCTCDLCDITQGPRSPSYAPKNNCLEAAVVLSCLTACSIQSVTTSTYCTFILCINMVHTVWVVCLLYTACCCPSIKRAILSIVERHNLTRVCKQWVNSTLIWIMELLVLKMKPESTNHHFKMTPHSQKFILGRQNKKNVKPTLTNNVFCWLFLGQVWFNFGCFVVKFGITLANTFW